MAPPGHPQRDPQWLPRHSEIVRGPPTGEEHGAVVGRARQGPKGAEHSDHLINVNTASQEELETLSGVGPFIARRIIEGRPYRTVDDLLRVKGIGARRWEEIRPLVGVR